MTDNLKKELYRRYINGVASDAEKDELFRYLLELPDQELDEMIMEGWMAFEQPENDGLSENGKQLLDDILHARKKEAAPVKKMEYRLSWKWVAASLLILGGMLYLWLSGAQVKDNAMAVATVAEKMDFPPGETGAVLTMDDGTKLLLDSLNTGVIANQNGTEVILKQGELSYQSAGADLPGKQPESPAMGAYHTVSTPKGRQFRLVLPDGSTVWLNAASSIRYPVRFSDSAREVQIKGEVFLTVAKNARAPFLVQTPKQKVEVLGTSFNISAYDDEVAEKTTLLEGIVRVIKNQEQNTVKSADGAVMLKPGEQAELVEGIQAIRINRSVDLEQVTAWKNGVFNFQDRKLDEIMKQIARWYDVEIVYEGKIPNKTFWGGMSRELTLTQCLKILEKANVRFSVGEGRKLIVRP
ncbi:MAG: FecR domain-containing protein [Chitinophagaceae bacterium]|nr:FecR domain-containing protein [Chitinophagaceae bacterium]